jgi:hypothetical protein
MLQNLVYHIIKCNFCLIVLQILKVILNEKKIIKELHICN